MWIVLFAVTGDQRLISLSWHGVWPSGQRSWLMLWRWWGREGEARRAQGSESSLSWNCCSYIKSDTKLKPNTFSILITESELCFGFMCNMSSLGVFRNSKKSDDVHLVFPKGYFMKSTQIYTLPLTLVYFIDGLITMGSLYRPPALQQLSLSDNSQCFICHSRCSKLFSLEA